MADASIPSSAAIYRIVCAISGKSYVGSAVHIERRWSQHRRRLGNGNHHSRHLQAAWRKYGATRFAFEIIETVNSAADLVRREQFWIDRLRACSDGYNVCPKAGSSLGLSHTEHAKAKMSATRRGRSRAPFSESHKANIAAAQRGKKRAPFSDDHRRAISTALAGRPLSTEHRGKLAAAHRALGAPKLTREQIERGAAKRTGAKRTPEQKARMAAARVGRKLSPAHCAAISAALIGRKRAFEQGTPV